MPMSAMKRFLEGPLLAESSHSLDREAAVQNRRQLPASSFVTFDHENILGQIAEPVRSNGPSILIALIFAAI